MLEPLRSAIKEHEFTVFDLEWWPGNYTLRMIGVFDRRKGYRYYTTVGEFLRKELTKKATNRRFYAHFGGSSDMIFILQYLLQAEWMQAKAIFAGSAAVITRISKGGRNSWTFVDSGFLIRRPLAEIGEWIGIAKGPKEAIYSENFDELKTYNETDCVILYDAIDRLQRQLNELGGELRATLASCALDLFRRRYLKQIVPVRDDINVIGRAAYIASRVEVFRKVCPIGEYYDINSSFPKSMSGPQPGAYLESRKTLPNPPALYLADLEVEVKPCYLPPLAYRAKDKRLLFPVGRWRSMFDSADVELLLAHGGRVLRVHEVTVFEPFSDLAEYVADLYERKAKAAGYEREVYKLLLNGLYGKFAERSDKWEILIRPAVTKCGCAVKCSEEDPCIEMISANIYKKRVLKEIPHAHVPISTHVTAASRALLYKSLAAATDLYYCDTDSIVCGPADTLPIGPELGALKHEYTIRDGRFLAPKLYAFESNGKRIVRAKGFSRLDYKGFCDLAEGRPYEIKRMQRLRESINADGTITPRDVAIPKRAHLATSKRRFLADGGSVPWSVAEVAG